MYNWPKFVEEGRALFECRDSVRSQFDFSGLANTALIRCNFRLADLCVQASPTVYVTEEESVGNHIHLYAVFFLGCTEYHRECFGTL